MSRKLKFRIWDKLTESFIYCEDDNQQHFILDLNGNFHNLQNGSGGDEYVVQQYTGFKDADGNEIYEGDILKNLTPTKYSDVNFIVEWGEFEPSDDMGVGGVGFVLPWFFTTFKPKVIGNIFENPELLK